jgi:hypothetical protein
MQNSSEINEDNLSNIRREAIRYFREKEREYLKDKITSLNQTVRNQRPV